MIRLSRRDFVSEVTGGMVVASLGASLATDLLASPVNADGPDSLTFGPLEPLVDLMQETPADRLLPILATRLREGTDIRRLLTAAALANARAFGGEDYIGFHTMMALSPAWHMAQELPDTQKALPIFKVLYRNTSRIQANGGARAEVLHQVAPGQLPEGRNGAELLRDYVRRRDVNQAERTFAALAQGRPEDAFNHLLLEVEDATEVHRVVLPYRAWDLLGIIGREQAHTLLRQSVRYCVRNENERYVESVGQVRTIIPRLLDRYRLPERARGNRSAEDNWVEQMSMTIFRATPERAADAVAAALAEGMAPAALGEAISLAANQLVLRDRGRTAAQAQPNKPVGSVHGDSIGVHGCDSANAWRNMARISNPRNSVVCLLLGAYQVAQDRTNRGGDFLTWEPYPSADARRQVRDRGQGAILRELDASIRARDQMRASAFAQAYGENGHPHRPIFDLLLQHAMRDDGALHGEKYYRTVSEEFNANRPAFRWRQVTALARVVASAYGQEAPGFNDARRILRVDGA